MTHSPVTLDTLHALFSEHFMGDATNGGAWRIVPRSMKTSTHAMWFDDHAKDSLRGQFWSADRNGLVCADEPEATSILITLETEFRAWHAT